MQWGELMNTVLLEGTNRTAIAQSPLRSINVDPLFREIVTNNISRTVEITVTYTFEEFYYVSPFQLDTELGEGPIYVIPNQTV